MFEAGIAGALAGMLIAVLMGTFGGLVRASVGILKLFEPGKAHRKPSMGYLASSLVVAAATGALAGALYGLDWRLCALAGYAGSDFLENMYKLKLRRALFPER